MESGNAVDEYPTESAAFEDLSDALTKHGPEYVESLALAEVIQHVRLRTIAAGVDLVTRVRTYALNLSRGTKHPSVRAPHSRSALRS